MLTGGFERMLSMPNPQSCRCLKSWFEEDQKEAFGHPWFLWRGYTSRLFTLEICLFISILFDPYIFHLEKPNPAPNAHHPASNDISFAEGLSTGFWMEAGATPTKVGGRTGDCGALCVAGRPWCARLFGRYPFQFRLEQCLAWRSNHGGCKIPPWLQKLSGAKGFETFHPQHLLKGGFWRLTDFPTSFDGSNTPSTT